MSSPAGMVTVVADGRVIRAVPGTSVAAALLGADTTAFRRSERGEPRAPLCGMGSCFECRVTIDGVPHRRSCLVTVEDGMRVETGDLRGNVPRGAGNGERGQPSPERSHGLDRDTGAQVPVVTADVAIVGAGPAGIAAAVTAAESGRTVTLLDSAPNAGGQIWRHRHGMAVGGTAARWLRRLERTHVVRLEDTAVVDGHSEGAASITVTAERDGAPLIVRARSLVVATGARERFLPFPGWTLPGVFGIGGVQALLKQGASFAGKRVVIGGSGPLMLPVASALSQAGARVVLVAEQASAGVVRRFALALVRRPATLLQAAGYRLGFLASPYRTGVWVTEAAGDDRVRRVTVTDGAARRVIECDALATGYGLVPNTELALLVGCEVRGGRVVVDERQATSVGGVYAAGEVTGVGGVELALVEGEIAGLAAAGAPPAPAHLVRQRDQLRDVATDMEATFTPRPELRAMARPDTLVCRCEDVPRSAVERFASTRQAKVHARAGMGACQGRVCGPALDTIFGWTRDTVRPPLEPAALSTLIMCDAARAAAPTDSLSGS